MPNYKLVQKSWQKLIKKNVFLMKPHLNKWIFEYSFCMSPNIRIQYFLKMPIPKMDADVIYFKNA